MARKAQAGRSLATDIGKAVRRDVSRKLHGAKEDKGMVTLETIDRHVGPERELYRLLWIYGNIIRVAKDRSRKIKSGIGRNGPLKESTIRQYKIDVKQARESQIEYKARIQDLLVMLREARSVRTFATRAGTTLRLYQGGNCSS